ncbi:MarR family winged helix-turn-helix transcriptional regulator [Andreprevotia chitinilytica]|uniref:MarR family winged helix-turn-helix transcriptional regulator n=1 Tax=Andreprevotia chitinilytica TaxID=396808 RepID=UPI00068C482C|nr:MarR family transcriptional regulator [Andreprevotia chitinilytica]
MPASFNTAILRDLMRSFINEQRQNLARNGFNALSRMLVVVLHRGSLSQAELGQILALEKSWVSRAVDKLVTQGWVERQPNPADRRGVLLQLTEAGRAEALAVEAVLESHAESVLARVPVTKLPAVLDALAVLRQAFDLPAA